MSCLICHSSQQHSQTFSKHLGENGHNRLYCVNHIQYKLEQEDPCVQLVLCASCKQITMDHGSFHVTKNGCCAGRNIEWNKCRNLVEVRSRSREAVFDVMKDGKSTGQTQVFKVCSAMCAVLLVYVYIRLASK